MVTKVKTFDVEQFFLALADRTRLRLLNLMGDHELCVCYFVQILEQSQPKISRHLAYLRKAGMVTARREGKWMHYRLATPPNPGAAMVLRQTLAWMQDEKTMQRDRARMAQACCNPSQFVELQRAPVPAVAANSGQ
jgi:ArsR family transcriptional regulator